MHAEALREHLSAQVEELENRVQLVAELQELMRRDQLPQSPLFAFVVPIGLNARSDGDASANAFTQAIDDVVGVVLVVRASGDITGAKGISGLDTLIWKVVLAVCGSGEDEAIGTYRFSRGRLVSLSSGTAFYQLDFAITRQIRVTP